MFRNFSSTHTCVVIILKPMSTLFFLFIKVVKPSFVSNPDDICMPVVFYLNLNDFLYRPGTSYQLMFNTQLLWCSECRQLTSVHSRSGRPLPDDCLAGVPCSVRSTRLYQGRGHSNVLCRLIKP